jgi:hypothetical protein
LQRKARDEDVPCFFARMGRIVRGSRIKREEIYNNKKTSIEANSMMSDRVQRWVFMPIEKIFNTLTLYRT